MGKLIEMVTLTFLGMFAMGNIDKVADGAKDVGSYGVTTGTTAELLFFLVVFIVIALIMQSYFRD